MADAEKKMFRIAGNFSPGVIRANTSRYAVENAATAPRNNQRKGEPLMRTQIMSKKAKNPYKLKNMKNTDIVDTAIIAVPALYSVVVVLKLDL